jgi:hypothetical protein
MRCVLSASVLPTLMPVSPMSVGLRLCGTLWPDSADAIGREQCGKAISDFSTTAKASASAVGGHSRLRLVADKQRWRESARKGRA